MPSSRTLREIVAEAIRREMGAQRLSGAKLAQAMGKSDMYVSRRLSADTALDLDDLQAIAAELGVPVSRLIPAEVTA